ncbi:MAG: hypothetical protein COX44_03125 [Candidatus Portnoybacteria bacterium CG23_combo_of_CG06-09_8_20_14_all_37_13]|uniref:HhH-GPD domain-containing protein n=1 Tax=Candidatus Portnoybacteria bacterium CG23_combo_of_CG06-09_8_20_14_all_37_13 TaxID=1974819 RepID=A0A2G9YEB5_9BACT|nr:MAG: hypothetical protein COX44_03125 [Candidatus Portnoybacteria bacterium CG23_combo_of_CG06-09_8_20_14_all_37_13]
MREKYILSLVQFSHSSKTKNLPIWERGFSRSDEANLLIFNNSYAFILGLIFDHGIKSNIAWTSPHKLKQRLGHLNVKRVADMEINQLTSVIAQKKSLHRFPKNTAKHIIESSRIIRDKFRSKADLIWHENKSIISAKKNFLKLCGIGEKKANLAILLLAREFRVKFDDVHLLDVALDSHVQRVLLRSGYFNTSTKEGTAELNSAFREVHPNFPALLGTPLWYVGRHFCTMTQPKCKTCPVSKWCSKLFQRINET